MEVVPGVTSALSGGALLGAPVGHDFCVISLSDLLTPWAEHIHRGVPQLRQGQDVPLLPRPARVADIAAHRTGIHPGVQQDAAGPAQVIGPRQGDLHHPHDP